MKMAWGGLLVGVSAMSAMAAPCESSSVQGEQQGKFDASGEVCFQLPMLSENYVQATLNGVPDAPLLDGQNRRLRALLEGGPSDGEQSLPFPLPVNTNEREFSRGFNRSTPDITILINEKE